MVRRFMGVAAAALMLAACGSGHDPDLQETGANPDIPELDQTLLPPMNVATQADWNGELPTVPDGYVISVVADDLMIPRQMLMLPNGDLLIAEGSGGGAPALRPKDVIAGFIKARGRSDVEGGDRITLVRDANGDGVPELRTVLIDDLNAPYGLAFVDGNLYVANQDAVMRFPYEEGQTEITAPGEELTRLPAELNHHWTKAMTASADGRFLYVGIGSNSNAGERGMEVEEERAVVWEIDRETGARRTIATGIRNPTALAIEPDTSALWAVVNERDEIGDMLVPDYLTQVQDGAFYGWPYSYWGGNVDPRPRPQQPDLVARAVTPDYALGNHVAALGLNFVTEGGFGGQFSNGAFIGEHGSWNRRDPSGYKVSWVPFANGRPSGPPVDFVTGFLNDRGEARGRPVGVLFDPRTRALFIADDMANVVWRVVPTQ
ncbi:MAG: PQQ-dependent sugar dehydrogenase [Brevundimonas sp.]|uniref:PQQ-dependent sugar dehydrogenase n=1 Tax=Brevundimonas sp. TaxID=1871086 RepID=UPI00391ACE0A